MRGELSVELSTDRLERVAPGARWHVRGRWVTVRAARPHQGRWLVSVDEITDRLAAQRWTNAPIYAEPIDDADVLWVHELIGARVVETSGRGRGRCVAVVANPAADLLELEDGALVPVVFVVDFHDGVVTIDPPAGLFED